MNTVFFFHPFFLAHHTGAHPERPERLESILNRLREAYGEALDLRSPRRADPEEVAWGCKERMNWNHNL